MVTNDTLFTVIKSIMHHYVLQYMSMAVVYVDIYIYLYYKLNNDHDTNHYC